MDNLALTIQNVQFAASCATKASSNDAVVTLIMIMRPDGALGLMPHPSMSPEEMTHFLEDAYKVSLKMLEDAKKEGRDKKSFDQVHKEATKN